MPNNKIFFFILPSHKQYFISTTNGVRTVLFILSTNEYVQYIIGILRSDLLIICMNGKGDIYDM